MPSDLSIRGGPWNNEGRRKGGGEEGTRTKADRNSVLLIVGLVLVTMMLLWC